MITPPLEEVEPQPQGFAQSSEQASQVRRILLRALSSAAFLLFFQAYMIAPLIPSLAVAFGRSRQSVGFLVPAYTLPFAFSALACGILGDRFGRRGLFIGSLAMFAVLSGAMSLAAGLDSLLLLRAFSGLTNAGIMVMGLSLIGDLYPPKQRGTAVGWVFGAVAGGGAFGATLGGLLAPHIGWRGLFIAIGLAGTAVVGMALPLWKPLARKPPADGNWVSGPGAYLDLLRSPRGARTYAYIVLNGMFHSGVFTWLGVLLHDRYGLGEAGIGRALLGYGIPGLLFGPLIGRLVDRIGRRRIIPTGLATAAASAAILTLKAPLVVASASITVLSLGFDMTHPLFAGIATTLDERRRGQAMGLNAFCLFLGFGLGSLIFGAIARFGMSDALVSFAIVQSLLALVAIRLFDSE